MAMESNREVRDELMNHLNKNTIMTIENCTVVFRLGLNVKIAFAKYEKTEADTKAIEFDQQANDISFSIGNTMLYDR